MGACKLGELLGTLSPQGYGNQQGSRASGTFNDYPFGE